MGNGFLKTLSDVSVENGQDHLDTMDDSKLWSYQALKRFRLIFKAVQQHSQQVETDSRVTSAQLWMMWELSKKPGSKVTELANAISIHHSTASNLLDKLEKKGLILRERISLDQRVVTVSLTQNGIDLINQAPSPSRGLLQHALYELPENVVKSLVKNLDVLVNQMQIKEVDSAMQPINPLPKSSQSKNK